MTDLADELDAYYESNKADPSKAVACALVRRAAEALRWVSVEERLPDVGDWVLVHSDWGIDRAHLFLGYHMDGSPASAWIDSAGVRRGLDGPMPTHWMPLPPEPKR